MRRRRHRPCCETRAPRAKLPPVNLYRSTCRVVHAANGRRVIRFGFAFKAVRVNRVCCKRFTRVRLISLSTKVRAAGWRWELTHYGRPQQAQTHTHTITQHTQTRTPTHSAILNCEFAHGSCFGLFACGLCCAGRVNVCAISSV